MHLFKVVPWKREGGEIIIQGKRYQEGSEVEVFDDSVFSRGRFPGQPPRALAGPARVRENWCLTIVAVIGVVLAIIQQLDFI